MGIIFSGNESMYKFSNLELDYVCRNREKRERFVRFPNLKLPTIRLEKTHYHKYWKIDIS